MLNDCIAPPKRISRPPHPDHVTGFVHFFSVSMCYSWSLLVCWFCGAFNTTARHPDHRKTFFPVCIGHILQNWGDILFARFLSSDLDHLVGQLGKMWAFAPFFRVFVWGFVLIVPGFNSFFFSWRCVLFTFVYIYLKCSAEALGVL